jgi:hypothetical protein
MANSVPCWNNNLNIIMIKNIVNHLRDGIGGVLQVSGEVGSGNNSCEKSNKDSVMPATDLTLVT